MTIISEVNTELHRFPLPVDSYFEQSLPTWATGVTSWEQMLDINASDTIKNHSSSWRQFNTYGHLHSPVPSTRPSKLHRIASIFRKSWIQKQRNFAMQNFCWCRHEITRQIRIHYLMRTYLCVPPLLDKLRSWCLLSFITRSSGSLLTFLYPLPPWP